MDESARAVRPPTKLQLVQGVAKKIVPRAFWTFDTKEPEHHLLEGLPGNFDVYALRPGGQGCFGNLPRGLFRCLCNFARSERATSGVIF